MWSNGQSQYENVLSVRLGWNGGPDTRLSPHLVLLGHTIKGQKANIGQKIVFSFIEWTQIEWIKKR
jgi:hypothetical protein